MQVRLQRSKHDPENMVHLPPHWIWGWGGLWEAFLEEWEGTQVLYTSTPEQGLPPKRDLQSPTLHAMGSTLSCVLATGNTHVIDRVCAESHSQKPSRQACSSLEGHESEVTKDPKVRVALVLI